MIDLYESRNIKRLGELEASLLQAKNRLEETDILAELSWELRISDPGRALDLSVRASELAQLQQPHYVQGLAAALVSRAFVGMYRGELSLAVSNCLQALSLLEIHPKSPATAKAWFTLGWTLFFLGDIPAAMEYAMKAQQLSRELGNTILQAWAMDGVASFQGITGDSASAVRLHQETLATFRELKDVEGEVRILNNQAFVLRQAKAFDAALQAGQRSVELAKQFDLKADVSNNCCTMVEILMDLDRLDEAEEYLKQAMVGYSSSPNVTHVYALTYQGQISRLRNDLEGAKSYLLQAMELAKRLNQQAAQAQCHGFLSEIYQQQACFAEALEQHKLFHQLQETIAGENSARRLEVLKVTYQVESAQQEAEIYRLQTQAMQDQMEDPKNQQSILEYHSKMDSLTDLHNRRYFYEALETEFSGHTHSESELSLIMLDVDFFKAFSETYGHVQGDECLRQVAQVLRGCLGSSSDLVARHDGDEFICLLPETNQEDALTVAETFREEVIKLAIHNAPSSVAEVVTISLGVVTSRCVQGKPAQELVALADQQLYAAKSGGRNRVKSVLIHPPKMAKG